MKAIITHTTPTHEDKVTILKGTHLVLREEEYGTISVMDKGTGEHVLLGAFKNCSSVMLKGKPKQPATPNRLDDAFDMIGDLHARIKDLEGFIPDITPRLDGHEAFHKGFANRLDQHQAVLGSLDATVQQFLTRMHQLESRLAILDCPKPKPPVATNPIDTPFVVHNDILFLSKAAVEKGLVIDSMGFKLKLDKTSDGRTVVAGMGLGLHTGDAELATATPISKAEAEARASADSALGARLDTIGTHPGDPEYPIPADSGWQASAATPAPLSEA